MGLPSSLFFYFLTSSSMIHILKAKLEELEHSKDQAQGAHRRQQLDAGRGDNATEEPVAHTGPMSDKTSTAITYSDPAVNPGPPPPPTPPVLHHPPRQQHRGDSTQSPQHANTEDSTTVSVPAPCDSPALPVPESGLAPSCTSSPSRCIQPSNFERMMMPISLAMGKMHGLPPDTSALPATSAPSTVLHHNSKADCTCDQSLSEMRCNLPLRRYSDTLVARYFSRHNRIFPILHRSTFLAQYERLWDSDFSSHSTTRSCSELCTQKSKGKMLPTIVYLVLALGSLFASQSHQENASRAEGFYRAAQETNFLEMMDDEVGIELVQAGLLMGIYLQSTERYSKCWNIIGFTIRMAQNMGLHFTAAEVRKRGLLACESDPLDVGLDFVKPPFEALHVSRSTEPLDDAHVVPPSDDGPSVLGYYYQKIKLYDLLRQVIQRDSATAITTMGRAADIDARIREVLKLDAQILEWQNDLPSYLRHPTIDGHERASPLNAGKGPGHLETLDIPALSDRLHNRFLHTRQLVLRPALEILFKHQQDKLTAATNNSKKSLEAELRETTLLEVASHCVRLAADMVEFLGSGIEAESFICWWYNINMLYTSGTTLLMGRFCRLNRPDLDRQSLAASWNHCLVCLSRYRDRCQPVDEGALIPTLQPAPVANLQSLNSSLEPPIGDDFPMDFSTGVAASESAPMLSLFDPNLRKDQPSMFLPDSYLTDTSAWPYLPFLSQLEDLSSGDPNMNFRMV
ncbi:hypothetical protein AYO22_10833 [Fonsecaea multimorphosa]|nr:hypothetical protein AYO22_10833 [Fonsecaea multimorphosa]